MFKAHLDLVCNAIAMFRENLDLVYNTIAMFREHLDLVYSNSYVQRAPRPCLQ